MGTRPITTAFPLAAFANAVAITRALDVVLTAEARRPEGSPTCRIAWALVGELCDQSAKLASWGHGQ